MNGAKLFLECLKKEQVDTIFGYPGGAVIPLYDALYDYKDDFTHIRTSHEQGLVHAADGYARSTKKVGVCFVTSGPGATNAITGIATAYMDSTPLIVISGQVPTTLLGKDSFQEIDITGATFSVTKHNYIVRKVEDIPRIIKEAFEIATSPRMGPVLIDVPKDIFLEKVKYDIDEYISSKKSTKGTNNFKNNYYDSLESVIKLINESKRPLIYSGGGVKAANCEKLLKSFANKIDTPILNTLTGISSIDRDDELSLGIAGMHGSREANLALTNCDLLLGIGVRFSDRVISKSSEFAKQAKIVHIDIDNSEINKNIEVNFKLVGELENILNNLMDKVNSKNNVKWRDEIKSFEDKSYIKENEFHPLNIINALNKKIGKDSIVVTDVGQHQMWTAKYWNFNTGRNFITSAGLGTMGFGVGAAIGSKVGNQDKNVVLITGDGSFRMNCNELATISAYNIPITIVLFNNSSLGMVRQWQKLFMNKRYSEIDIQNNVDYVQLAKAYGINGYEINSLDELNDVLSKLNLNEPIFLQCNIDKEYDVYPIVAPNDKLENLICN